MDCMALSKWIRWLYFHGLGGSATMEYSIIANGENGPTSNHVWTIYNIDTNEETIIPIDFSEMGNDVPARSAFLEIKDDKYYLLFPSYLVEYDIQGKKSKTYNLKDLGIENAVLITAQ